MSLRWKYIIVVNAALLATAAGFLLAYELGYWPESKKAIIASVLVVGGCLSLVLMAAYRSYVQRPLRKILDTTHRLAEGATGLRIELDEHDEMEAIAAAVNRLVAYEEGQLLELAGEIEEQREDLHAVLEEVAERNEIHEEVHRRLEDADRRKMHFLTNVSHELRTPLTSIRGFLKLLEERLYDSDEERQEFFDNSRQAAEHMLHVLDDTLQAARIDREVLIPRTSPVAGGDAAVDVLRMLDGLVREKGIAIHLETEGGSVVMADVLLLHQVLINLVGNAIKFTEEGSVTLRVRQQDDFVRFEVQDTGIGVDPAELESIFFRFHQADAEVARAKGGIGLGLALSRQLIELMGGTLGGWSDGLGTGACFYFTLPAAPATLPA
ncbi:MAG: sensor histidine kinase [Planctomycetota bacterium]